MEARTCREPCTAKRLNRAPRQGLPYFPPPTTHDGRRLVIDARAGQRFLVDTGSEISVMPRVTTRSLTIRHRTFSPQRPSDPNIRARTTTTRPGLQSNLFLDVRHARCLSTDHIRADFLLYNGLLVDVRHNRLIDRVDNYFVKLTPLHTPSRFRRIARLREYPEVTRQSPRPVPKTFLLDVDNYRAIDSEPPAVSSSSCATKASVDYHRARGPDRCC